MKLRFVQGGAWDSRLIEYTTRCRWSHVEALYDDHTLGAMLVGGVRFRSLKSPQYKHAVAYQVVEIAASPLTESHFDGFLEQQIGKPYDWRSILAFGLGQRDWRNPLAWFCSELVLRGLEFANIVQLPADIPMTRITPRDLWMLLAGKATLLPSGARLLAESASVTFMKPQEA